MAFKSILQTFCNKNCGAKSFCQLSGSNPCSWPLNQDQWLLNGGWIFQHTHICSGALVVYSCILHESISLLTGVKNWCCTFLYVHVHDVFSSSQHNSSLQTSRSIGYAPEPTIILASGNTCPLPWYILVAPCYRLHHLLLSCLFPLTSIFQMAKFHQNLACTHSLSHIDVLYTNLSFWS